MRFDYETYMKKINYEKYTKDIEGINDNLVTDSMTDWYNIEKCITKEELNEIKETADFVRKNCDVFLVIGIGGSFLGAKSVIEALTNYFEKTKPEVIFVGTSLSSDYLHELYEHIKDKEVMINLISKSGSTLEPNLAFEYLMDKMEKKYSKEELSKRVIITTDRYESKLLDLALEKDYRRFSVPTQIGGRYSVLTPVGLLPIAVAGLDIDKLLAGARKCDKDEAIKYAIIRNELYSQGYYIESFTIYEEKMLYFTEWLKQLFAETQGKDNKGILPISVLNTRDLHSLGQYYQEGKRIIFETVINIVKERKNIKTNYGKSLNDINNIACDAVAKAHYNGGVYSNIIELDELNEETIGYLIYFFELSAAIGGYLLHVNPFDQPGVSEYKRIMMEVINNDSI